MRRISFFTMILTSLILTSSLVDAQRSNEYQRRSLGWLLKKEGNLSQTKSISSKLNKKIHFQCVVEVNSTDLAKTAALGNRILWKTLDYSSKIIGTRKFTQVLEPVKRTTERFYEDLKMVSICGIQRADNRFFRRYGAPPRIVARSENPNDLYPTGTLLRVYGSLKYSSSRDLDPINGIYFKIDRATPEFLIKENNRLTPQTTEGDWIKVVGVKQYQSNVLTNADRKIEYSYRGLGERSRVDISSGSVVQLYGKVNRIEKESTIIGDFVKKVNITVMQRPNVYCKKD